jgi:hypothetical protein
MLQFNGRSVPEFGVGAFPARPIEIRELARRNAVVRRPAVSAAIRERTVARAWQPAWGARPLGFGAARWQPAWGKRPAWFGATQWKREFGPQPAWWAAHQATAQSDDSQPDDSQSPAPPSGSASKGADAPAAAAQPDASQAAPSGDAATPPGRDENPSWFAAHKVALIVVGAIAAAGGATALVLAHK